MNQFLVLRIANPYSWVITGADGGRVGPVATGELADAAPIAKERPVVVVAPGSSVTLARPELPIKAGARLAQVVPYAMEESLAGEVENFHFAIGATDADGSTQVAALRREEMRAWLDALAAAGIAAAGDRPGHALPPGQPGQDRRGDRLRAAARAGAGVAAGRARRGAADRVVHARRTRGRRPPRAALRVAARLAAFARDDRGAARSDGQPRPADPARRRAAAARSPGGAPGNAFADAGRVHAPHRLARGMAALARRRHPRGRGPRAPPRRARATTSSACTTRSSGSMSPSSRPPGSRCRTPNASRTRARRSSSGSRDRAAADPAGLLAQLAAVGGALAGAPGPKLESLGWRERALELQIVARQHRLHRALRAGHQRARPERRRRLHHQQREGHRGAGENFAAGAAP